MSATATTLPVLTPRAYLSRRTRDGVPVFTVIERGMPAIADTADGEAAERVARQVCGDRFHTWDGDRGEFLPLGDPPAPFPHKLPAAGTEVFWNNPLSGWRCGEFVGFAAGESGAPGDPFVEVNTSSGRCHVRLSAISWTERPPVTAAGVFTVRKTKLKGRPAEVLTFTGTTDDQYDVFLDARHADGREAIGFDESANAPYRLLPSGKLVRCRYRRYVL